MNKNRKNISTSDYRYGKIFSRIHYKINTNIENKTNSILALDVLKNDIKSDLLRIVTFKVSEVFCERGYFTGKRKSDMYIDKNMLLLNIIKESAEILIFKYYGEKIILQKKLIQNNLTTKSLIKNRHILFDIPILTLSNQIQPRIFDSIFAPIYNSINDVFLSILVENLIIKTSDCVASIIINKFSRGNNIRQTFYKLEFLTFRNLEKFKNNLNWQNTLMLYVQQPFSIYYSSLEVWFFKTDGLANRYIYANRLNELKNLDKLSLSTIFFFELKDFLSTRFEEIVYVLGRSIRYTFTSFTGQMIGLIWRGIIDGLKK
jgi:hypothetical protein|tara:strand:+ start:3180 stop:4130 length:951 start_codon:yes stop_codon:yes gene_type:complete